MNINVMQYLEEKPRLENSWRADMVRLIDALNDNLMDVKTNTKSHVIHTRISEIQHTLEHVAQEFLNTERDNKKEMGIGYFNVWKEKRKTYKKSHKDNSEVKPNKNHASYKALVKTRSLMKAMSKTTDMLVDKKKFRNFIVADWFALMSKYLKLISTYEKL